MEQRPYGDTGLTVSALAYGAMSVAQDPDIRDGVAPSLLAALEGGVTLIDTARAYGGLRERDRLDATGVARRAPF